MSSFDRYAMPAETDWTIPNEFETRFDWEYEDGRADLLNLYRKAKRLQWNAEERIDWSQDLDPENPAGLPDVSIPIFGSPVWERLTEPERTNLRHHVQAWQISQFLHGEQGALVCTGEDRAAGAEHGREVLRGHPGGGRGAPRGSLLAGCSTRSSSWPTRSTPTLKEPDRSRSCATRAGT